ncbi:MAG TPA: hypothetical protein VMT18_01565 [Planctomycetota bacterium]|nr:hypothetical protein [Planctomycetota bacterium]
MSEAATAAAPDLEALRAVPFMGVITCPRRSTTLSNSSGPRSSARS